jgi:hypothetical protein
VGGRELARLSPLPEHPASGRAERAECAHHRQTRSDRALTRSCGTPPASPLPRGFARARGPPAPDPTPGQQTSALAESVATSWKDGARAPPADPSSRGSRSPPKG